jgi:hypothetical protein
VTDTHPCVYRPIGGWGDFPPWQSFGYGQAVRLGAESNGLVYRWRKDRARGQWPESRLRNRDLRRRHSGHCSKWPSRLLRGRGRRQPLEEMLPNGRAHRRNRRRPGASPGCGHRPTARCQGQRASPGGDFNSPSARLEPTRAVGRLRACLHALLSLRGRTCKWLVLVGWATRLCRGSGARIPIAGRRLNELCGRFFEPKLRNGGRCARRCQRRRTGRERSRKIGTPIHQEGRLLSWV